jgi:ankyrin repeat protein
VEYSSFHQIFELNFIVFERAHDGATTIMLAAQSSCLECVKLLADHGANPNLKANDGVMAVHLAVIGNHNM